MPNQDINLLFGSDEWLHFSTINRVEDLDAHVEDVVQCITNHDKLKIVVMDEPLAIEDEKKKKKIYDALLWKPLLAKLLVGPKPSAADNKRFLLDILASKWVAQVLCEVKSLKVLLIANVDFDNEAAGVVARALRRNRTLKLFGLWEINKNRGGDACDIMVQGAVQSLRFRSSLKIISLCYCALSEATYTAVAEALQLAHSSLEVFDFSSKSELSPQIGAKLLNSIATNKTLKSIYLAMFGPDTADNIVGSAISRLLSNNTTLQSLVVAGPFRPEDRDGNGRNDLIDVSSFASSLAGNQSLKEFALDAWGISDRGIRTVCDAVMENNAIQFLGMIDNDFGLEGLKAIKDLLSHETALANIDVGGNRIDDEGISYICEPLEGNDTIEELQLYANAFGEEGAVKLGRSLTRNKGLKRLYLGMNELMGERGIRAVLNGIKAHSSITEVHLGDSWGTAVEDELYFYLERNKGAKKLLSANPPLPLSLWPRVFKKADSCQHAPNDRKRAPDMLNFFVKEKVDLFKAVPASRERKRRRTK